MRVLWVVALLASSAPALARPASSGWYTEGGLGAVGFLPGASDDAAPGPALDLRIGRDLFSWLSIGVAVSASSHEATVPPPPSGEWFQLYRGGGEARLGARFDAIAIWAEGSAGLAMMSSNVLRDEVEPGERFSIAFSAGAGYEYQLENRHYAIGAGADGFLLPQFAAITAIAGRLYLRYTY